MIGATNNISLYTNTNTSNSHYANIRATEKTSAAQPVTPIESTKYTPDLARLDSIYAEQKKYIEGLQNIVKQISYQLNGAAMSNGNAQNNPIENNAKTGVNNLYDLAGRMKIGGLSDMQDYFSMFVRNPDKTFTVNLSGVSPEVADALIAKAKEDVSENGYFGVKKTSARIFDFAQALTGGDPSKMGMMQKVVDKAFKDVGKIFGGLSSMPEISRNTYDAVMKMFGDFSAAQVEPEQTA